MIRPRLYSLLFAPLLVSTAIGSEWKPIQQVAKVKRSASQTKTVELAEGEVVDLRVGIVDPTQLPRNGRLRVAWQLVKPTNSEAAARFSGKRDKESREANAFDITSAPVPNWSKLLHALDCDGSVFYRAPVAGSYKLTVSASEDATELFSAKRWREAGKAPDVFPIPDAVKWGNEVVDVDIRIKPVDLGNPAANRTYIELEPNDTPELAQPIALPKTKDEYRLHLIGSSDDIEYFDNGSVGSSGDDWIRLEFAGPEPRLLTACLSIPDQQVAARIRVYRIKPSLAEKHRQNFAPTQLLPIEEYTDGKNENERNHQQTEQHRIAVNRNLVPGGIYFLRVESNAPGYDLELRVVRPAPYSDPRRAIEQGLYDHIGQVDAWLTNRPRGASVERRIRDSGNLLGTNCMSCHTQSGVWGPAIPFAQGYRPQNVQLWRHLINTCYQSLRPTNHLKDAANNTSLRPLDTGDGPAGTRVAGHAVVSLERFMAPRKLQSMQSRRTANYVLQTSDPGGINAAGPGANVGQGVVFNYAGEIVFTAWKATGESRYFRSLEDKARRMLKINLKYCDDLGHRVEFFSRYFPRDYVKHATEIARGELKDKAKVDKAITDAKDLDSKLRMQVKSDLQRLRKIQLPGGGWSFDPGVKGKDGKYTLKDKKADPSPTSLALIAFEAAGVKKDDPTVEKGIQALLNLQRSTGLWKVASQTGFVSTSYALHALSRYFPGTPPKYRGDEFAIAENASLPVLLKQTRAMAVTQDPVFVKRLAALSQNEHPAVRYWALLGLGYSNGSGSEVAVAQALGDSHKMVREAAHWSLRQLLIHDLGWNQVFNSLKSKDHYRREAAVRALVMKVDSVMPNSKVNHDRLVRALDHALNTDSHPGVRAWATRAAWQWWVWNPPVRKGLNQAWQKLLTRPESNALVENAIRYQSQALFIVNGNIASGSKEHQYKELSELFAALHKQWRATRSKDQDLHQRLNRRLAGVAATFYSLRGGDGGPGSLSFVTANSGPLFGDVILEHLKHIDDDKSKRKDIRLQSALEAAANIPHESLQERLVEYSINGPEAFRSLAATSISDPRLVSLIAVPEQLEPMIRQLDRGANEPARRKDLSDPILKMIGGVKWILPKSDEQREEILQFLIPKLDTYRSKMEIKSIADPVAKQKAERSSDAAWYVADGLGAAIAKNPDLHFEQLAEAFPEKINGAAQARFWVQSVPWILEYKRKLPAIKVDPKKLPPIDPYEELRTRALGLLLAQLTETADARNRKIAADLANRTALKRNPEVLTALEAMLSFEKDKGIVNNAKKVLSQSRGAFAKELVAALKAEKDHGFELDKNGNPKAPKDFVDDFTYFRDYVIPEMTKVLRGDERSCMICHGEPGRVPSMELFAPDQVGYLPVDKLLKNYRILQQRVDLAKVDRSKLLRKPLNVQSGKEDGHQGGRRYQVTDPGYLILKRWVTNQVELQRKYGRRIKKVAVNN